MGLVKCPVLPFEIRSKSPMSHCNQCCGPIFDRYIMRINDQSYHERCLQCCVCGSQLNHSCFWRDSKLFCRDDYERIFVKKCLSCSERVNPEELVMRTNEHIFHLGCFVCVVCGIRLQKGDQFVIKQGQLFCRSDYEKEVEMLQGFQQSGDYYADDYLNGNPRSHDGRRGPKRPRTILTTQQRRAFKASFELSPKPCRKVRETLAKETGLSVRIVQVWFQNQRAKVKKIEKKARADPVQSAAAVAAASSSSSSSHSGGKGFIDPDDHDDTKSPKMKIKEEEKSPSAASSLLNDSCSDTDLPLKSNSDSFNELDDSTELSTQQSRKYFSIKKEMEPEDFFRETRTFFDGFPNTFQSRFDPLSNSTQILNHSATTANQYLTPVSLSNLPQIGSQQSTNATSSATLSLNPIDRLYSMQSSYFCADEPQPHHHQQQQQPHHQPQQTTQID